MLPGLNPLHCGAVVASTRTGHEYEGRRRSQSPSLRGSGRFHRGDRAGADRLPRVSIPFIAGQWSLPGPRLRLCENLASLNPLHCGAVVASITWRRTPALHSKSQSPSLRGSGRFSIRARRTRRMAGGLNPLHCGAVVASLEALPDHRRHAMEVSIPFIAGQWSLPFGVPRFRRADRLVSIPFIAGQWSLLLAAAPGGSRGRRRLNPLHCGAVVASRGRARRRTCC